MTATVVHNSSGLREELIKQKTFWHHEHVLQPYIFHPRCMFVSNSERIKLLPNAVNSYLGAPPRWRFQVGLLDMAEVGQSQLPYLTAERGLLLVRKHLSGYEQSEVARAIEIHNQSFRYVFVFFLSRK